jgi:hypothetical protein
MQVWSLEIGQHPLDYRSGMYGKSLYWLPNV